MKLVNRVSVFFLAALAVVLVVYSISFYVMVRSRLVQQFEQELYAALNALIAAVEVEPEEVKWQPLEHIIALGAVQGPEEVRWVVIGDGHQVVEQSRNASADLVAQAKEIASRSADNGQRQVLVTSGDWHVLHQRLVAPTPVRSERELDEFDELVVVAAHSAAPLNADLQRLLLLVSMLPLGAWLIAAAAGHWFCRRALQPVLNMAQQARSMTGADFHSRLPVSDTQDELSELAVAFNTLLDRQHRAFEQQQRFTGDAAHELRTPLTVLLGQIEVSLRRPRSPEQYAETLALLRDQTVQLQRIVESLLFLARADEDAVLPDSETVALDQWLPSYLHRWDAHPRRADIGLHGGCPGGCPIRASTALLARLLDNLIENALKYSEPGSPVEVSLTGNATEAIVSVEDHGRGIASDDQAAIFQPFFRSRAARNAGVAGAGLGLAIAARIATASGGRLDCTSELDRGSRFTLRLPLVTRVSVDEV